MLTKALLTALAATLVVAVSPAKADGGNEFPGRQIFSPPAVPGLLEGHGYVPAAAITYH